MKPFALILLALVAGVFIGCSCGAPATLPVMDVALPKMSIPPPIWFHEEQPAPQFIPQGYVQAVQTTMSVPVTKYVPVPAAPAPTCSPAWTPVPATAPCP